MRNVLGVGMFSANASHARVRGFAGFREGIVAAVEVFAFLQGSDRNSSEEGCCKYLELVLEKIFFVGELPVHPK